MPRRGLRLDRVVAVNSGVWRTSMVVAAATAALAFASWGVAAVAHVDDGHRIDHVAGTWMALARDVNEGTLYPPLYDGERFGGTRFMPIPIVIEAAAARATGEYLVSAKALGGVVFAALLVLTFVLLRRRCPTPVALLLVSTLVVSGTGLVAGLSVRNDALPVLLQLVAVSLVARCFSTTRVAVAGALCGIAVMSKLSAVWAPMAIGVWLLFRARRKVPVFAVVFASVLTVSFGAVEFATHGRLSDNVIGLTLATERLGPIGEQLSRLRLIAREGLGAMLVLPLLATAASLAGAMRGWLTLYGVAFTSALVVTGVVLADPGAFVNHLLDLQVLSLFVVADLWRRLTPTSGGLSVGTAAILALLLVSTVAAYRQNIHPLGDVQALVQGVEEEADRVPPLASELRDGMSVLSEDPFVAVARDEAPVVLDPFMLLRVGDQHPDSRADLVNRIEAKEFDRVILLYEPHSAPYWYERLHLGSEVVEAIERSYRPARRVDGYWVFVRR